MMKNSTLYAAYRAANDIWNAARQFRKTSPGASRDEESWARLIGEFLDRVERYAADGRKALERREKQKQMTENPE